MMARHHAIAIQISLPTNWFDYLVVGGEGTTSDQLYNRLTAVAFGQILPEAKDFAYVGGPNATVEIEQRDGVIYGEIWIPVVKK